jgi:hypothetical protein
MLIELKPKARSQRQVTVPYSEQHEFWKQQPSGLQRRVVSFK